MSEDVHTTPQPAVAAGTEDRAWAAAALGLLVKFLPLGAVLTVLYWEPFRGMETVWSMEESYYSHGYLIPPIALFFAWRKRDALMAAPRQSSVLGYPLLLAASLMILIGDFLGFRVFVQLSIIPMLFGLILLLGGMAHARLLWFPVLFLVFMVPIPPSMTQSIALQMKLLATQLAVGLAQFATLPMVQEGSFIHFKDDRLLVGEVCGGLRSLIALLAFGAVMAYISKTRTWGKWLLLLLSAPIAIVSNVFRIFLLCVAGYFYGSEFAAGRFHDISGVLIFVVAFILFFSVEALLRRVAPAKES